MFEQERKETQPDPREIGPRETAPREIDHPDIKEFDHTTEHPEHPRVDN